MHSTLVFLEDRKKAELVRFCAIPGKFDWAKIRNTSESRAALAKGGLLNYSPKRFKRIHGRLHVCSSHDSWTDIHFVIALCVVTSCNLDLPCPSSYSRPFSSVTMRAHARAVATARTSWLVFFNWFTNTFERLAFHVVLSCVVFSFDWRLRPTVVRTWRQRAKVS